jgi:hypothetical protein
VYVYEDSVRVRRQCTCTKQESDSVRKKYTGAYRKYPDSIRIKREGRKPIYLFESLTETLLRSSRLFGEGIILYARRLLLSVRSTALGKALGSGIIVNGRKSVRGTGPLGRHIYIVRKQV